MNPGSETLQINLTRDGPNQPWGFRLQGGADFTIPLSVQSINPGSIAERVGLMAGDAVLQINNRASDELEHEQAKQEIIASGNNVFLVVQRGSVKIWKPKVTPMSELRPQEVKLLPDGSTDLESYVQKTSLAADKPVVQHIGSGYNRTARPFGFGGGASQTGTVPGVVNAQYNTPLGLYSTDNAVNTYQAQSEVLTGKMQSLTVEESEYRGRSPSPSSFNTNASNVQSKRSVSPNVLTISSDSYRSKSPTFRAPSPNFRAPSPSFQDDGQDPRQATVYQNVLQELKVESGGPDAKSSIYKDLKDGEEIHYHGYVDPRKQSRTFHLLEKGLAMSEQGDAANVETGANEEFKPPGIRSVKAPVYDPTKQQEIQQANQMTCKICGRLVIGVFVRIKGDPLHPECFKCCRCGKNLKNQGYFHIEGEMYCEVHAKEVSQPAGQDGYAVPVYR